MTWDSNEWHKIDEQKRTDAIHGARNDRFAADRIADLTAALEQATTRAEAAEAELREVEAELRDRTERVRALARKWTHGSLFDLFMEAVK